MKLVRLVIGWSAEVNFIAGTSLMKLNSQHLKPSNGQIRTLLQSVRNSQEPKTSHDIISDRLHLHTMPPHHQTI